jgi:hypothetical protein
MTKEFKIKKFKDATVYTLESATGGGTSAGSIASVSSPMGGVRRRGDNLIAQEANTDKIDASKPRNFVAKNAKMGGAGQHKDKKKAEKQGDVKHKNKDMDMAEEGYGNHPSQRVDPRTGKKYVPPKSPLGQGVAEGERTMSRAAKGNEKYGKDGMRALAKAGREGASEKKLDAIRDKHDNYNEDWSKKYKSSINCSHPKGFSQKAHCAGKKKHEESMMTMEAVCPDCGMCETHGDNMMEVKQRLDAKCWKGFKKQGTKMKGGTRVNNCVPVSEGLEDPKDNPCWKGYKPVGTKEKGGRTVPNCVPKEGVAEDHEIQMASSELQSIAKNAVNLLSLVRKYSENDGLEAWQQSKITKAADYLNSVLQSVSGEQSALGEVSLGDYRNKALKQKAQSQMGAMFARDPAEREKNLATFDKREKGLNRLKARDEKSRADAQTKQLSDLVARLPELKAEYERMKDEYKSLGGSNWQYADREQNLTDRERKARSMEGPMNNLWRQIQSAEKSQGVAEGDAYMESLVAKLAEKIPANAPVDVWIKDFEKSTAPQFRGKNLAKRKQMAIAASYGAKNPKKKK